MSPRGLVVTSIFYARACTILRFMKYTFSLSTFLLPRPEILCVSVPGSGCESGDGDDRQSATFATNHASY